jgi:uncharacterized protein YqhQ
MVREIPVATYSQGASRYHPKCAINSIVMSDFVGLCVFQLLCVVNITRAPKMMILPLMGVAIFLLLKLRSMFGMANSDVMLNKTWRKYKVYLITRTVILGFFLLGFT